MDADELIEEFLTEHVDAIVTDHPQSTIIVDAKHKYRKSDSPQNEWVYLVKSPSPANEWWYSEEELLNLTPLIEKYWEINSEYDKDWDWLGGHNDPSMDTKSPFELMSIP